MSRRRNDEIVFTDREPSVFATPAPGGTRKLLRAPKRADRRKRPAFTCTDLGNGYQVFTRGGTDMTLEEVNRHWLRWEHAFSVGDPIEAN